jgi:uncharacterized protein with PIN domain
MEKLPRTSVNRCPGCQGTKVEGPIAKTSATYVKARADLAAGESIWVCLECGGPFVVRRPA